MHRLTTDLISQACRVFLPLAYPGGEAAIPVRKRPLLNLPPGQEMLAYLPGDPLFRECCQVVNAKSGGVRAFLVRLTVCFGAALPLPQSGASWRVQPFHLQRFLCTTCGHLADKARPSW